MENKNERLNYTLTLTAKGFDTLQELIVVCFILVTIDNAISDNKMIIKTRFIF